MAAPCLQGLTFQSAVFVPPSDSKFVRPDIFRGVRQSRSDCLRAGFLNTLPCICWLLVVFKRPIS